MMRHSLTYVLLLSLVFIAPGVLGQVTFHTSDDFIKANKGATVRIAADTAYVVSTSRIRYINNQLDNLDSIQLLYNDLVDNRNTLLDELKKTNKVLKRIGELIEADSTVLSNDMAFILRDLSATLNDLKRNNGELKKNNETLEHKSQQLERLVKELRKETKGIWWNGLLDKVVVFAGGVGVGLLVAAL